MSAAPPPPIHPVPAADAAAFVRATARGFGHSLDDETTDELVATEMGDGSRPIASYDDGRIVGTAVALDWMLAMPYGPSAPCAAVTSVAVMPTHRRRGVMRSLMRRQLDDVHAAGIGWAALYSSESAIYGRFGYGVAARCSSGRIDRVWTDFATPVAPADVELLTGEQAVDRVQTVYAAVQPELPGMMAVPDRYWRHRVAWDPSGERKGASERMVAVIGEHAYAMYRLANDWDETGSKMRLTIEECLAADVRAHRQLWTYLLGIDLVQQVTINRLAVDDPLPWWLAERQRLRVTASMPLYVRLVDVGAALSRRGTRGEHEVVLDVADGFCPWNRRRWSLHGDGSSLRCEPTDDVPDVGLDVRELASLSLGGVTAGELARAGLITEHRPGALTRLGTLLASPRPPYNAFTF